MHNKYHNKDIRDIFFKNINNYFKIDRDLYILTNDADVFALKDIKKNKRFIDVGVCEQNLINIAAGLASKKKKVVIFGFCNFLIHRAYEQIKINVGSMKLPVKIIGIGPGLSFPYDGPTHHATQDISCVYNIPEFEIFNISEPNLAYYVSKNLFKIKRPIYIRLDKGIFPPFLYNNFNDGFNFTNKKENKLLIISSGYFTHLANSLLKKNEFSFDLLNIFKLRDINKKKFLTSLKLYKQIIIYDENTYEGGISPMILKILIENQLNQKIYLKLLKSDQIFLYSQERDVLINSLDLGPLGLGSLIKKVI